MLKTTRYIQESLGGIYPPEEIRALTRLLWEEVCRLSPVEVILHKDKVLDECLRQKIEIITEKLRQGEPIQYILGYTHFCGLRIDVEPGVLIPRPETEELVALIAAENMLAPNAKIIDMGTGSGCIAIALSHRYPDSRVEGWDISPDALRIATENNHHIGTSVTFRRHDILHDLLSRDEAASCDLIVSNPPYIVPSEQAVMTPQVLDHEPHIALFVPEDDPLLFYRAIARAGAKLLHPGGRLYFEINPLFAEDMRHMLTAENYHDIALRTDLSGKLRFASATR